MITYAEVIQLLHDAPAAYAPLFFGPDKQHIHWIPIDKREYKETLASTDDWSLPFPCRVEREPDGMVYLHPNMENK